VRAMAVWALGRHDPTRARQLAKDWLAHEQDPAVRDEWQAVGT